MGTTQLFPAYVIIHRNGFWVHGTVFVKNPKHALLFIVLPEQIWKRCKLDCASKLSANKCTYNHVLVVVHSQRLSDHSNHWTVFICRAIQVICSTP